MTNKNGEQLDNPVWHSLSETHRDLSIEYDSIKFYHPDYCPFGAFVENSESKIKNSGVKDKEEKLLPLQSKSIPGNIFEYSVLCNNFFIVGSRPEFPDSLKLKNELVCNQMFIHDKIHPDIREAIIKLDSGHINELSQLINLVQPGYFKRKTFLLGNYYGIFNNNQLVAVTGERMKMNKYVEVSAVVTHPDYTGRGYAKQLVTHAVNNIFKEGKIPYLHVAETNIGAINLYEKLGFQTRRKMSFWNLIK